MTMAMTYTDAMRIIHEPIDNSIIVDNDDYDAYEQDEMAAIHEWEMERQLEGNYDEPSHECTDWEYDCVNGYCIAHEEEQSRVERYLESLEDRWIAEGRAHR